MSPSRFNGLRLAGLPRELELPRPCRAANSGGDGGGAVALLAGPKKLKKLRLIYGSAEVSDLARDGDARRTSLPTRLAAGSSPLVL